MITDDQFLTWLLSASARRTVLFDIGVRVAGVETTRYLSTRPYTTADGLVAYTSIVADGAPFTEQLAVQNGTASMSFGDIELDNTNGVRDAWSFDVWRNRPVRARVGDVSWPIADFRDVLIGVIDDIAPKGRDKLALKLRDTMQRLNTPVSEEVLGGDTPNANVLIPIALGEVHNITPLLADPSTLTFQCHLGASERNIEVRANGLPVDVTTTLATSKFSLAVANASAVITASWQGDNTGGYTNTVAGVVKRLATRYGKPADRFTDADIDLANFAAFEAAHPEPVGIYMKDRVNVITAIQQVASSLGAQAVPSRLGKLRLLRVELPPSGAPREIRPQNMVEKTLAPVARTQVVAAVTLGFDKNWTVQDNLQTALPPEHIALFAKEWITETAVNTTVQADYRLDTEPVQTDTMLKDQPEAAAEAARQLALWSVPHTIYEFDGFAEMLTLELGQAIRVYHPRYGMADGVLAQVVALSPSWQTARVKVRFIV